jgi:sugar/nucleoside kinase (ribokinase family)
MEMKNIKDILNKYLEYGAKRVVIREGADGSTYADSEGNYIKVPAVKVEKIIDQTGAGNAYCAGLAVAFLISDTTEDALCRAAVSASFPLEQFGALFSLENIQEHARKRFLECRKKIFSQGE